MKHSLKYLAFFAAAVLSACSSMELSESKSLEGNFPKDFDNAEYVSLHPGLVSLQIQDYVKAYNNGLGMSKDSVTEDTLAFSADTASLHKIFTNPIYAGYTEELWEENWEPLITDSTICETRLDTVFLNLNDLTQEDTVIIRKVYRVDSLGYDDDGILIYVSGVTDTTEGTVESFTLEEGVIEFTNKGLQTKTDTLSCETIEVSSEGMIPRDQMRYLKNFNFNDTRDDLKALGKIKIDTFAVVYQYIVFGKDHGWAYRKCSKDELKNPIKSEEYPVTKLYCVDEDDFVREISDGE